MAELMSDFPKLECPFIRKTFKVDKDSFHRLRSKFNLREPEVYLVQDEINPGYEWVFEDKDTFATEKLDGTNVKIKTEGGRLVAVQNRKNVIDPLQVIKGKTFIIEGVFTAVQKEYVKPEGEQFGEVIGPKLQGNPYGLANHLWYPFELAIERLRYKSFDKHERTFDNWSSWFKDYLKSLFHSKQVGGLDKAIFAEGVVFYNLKRRSEGKTWMAKLRRNMFEWYYEGLDIIKSDEGEIYTGE